MQAHEKETRGRQATYRDREAEVVHVDGRVEVDWDLFHLTAGLSPLPAVSNQLDRNVL